MSISRKNFFKGLAVGAITLPVALRTFMGKNLAQDTVASMPGVVSGKRYEWKMVTTWPPNFPILDEAARLFARLVQEMSAGRMNIRVYGAGELVPPLEAFDTVRSGAAELGSGAAYYWVGKTPAANFFAAIPFGMNAQQMNTWILSGGGMQLWEELYRDFNLIPMVGGNTGLQMAGWFNKEINEINDLKGLRMRIPGLGGRVLAKAGGAPVLMAGGEIYTNLERGVIDAAEWLGPYHDYLMGFHEIAKFYYSPGWHEPGTVLEFIANKQLLEALPKDLQTIIRAATAYVSTWTLLEMEARNAESLQIFIKENIKIRRFPAPVMSALRQYSTEVIEEIIESDPFSKKVYEAFSAFRAKAKTYAGITEKVFYEELQS